MITREQFDNYILPCTLVHEGGYVNDPDDRGGETYRGISRRSNPKWRGWELLERYQPLRRGDVINDPGLKEALREIYWDKYFIANKFDQFNDDCKALVCFDFAVNGGYKVSTLQRVLNCPAFGNNLVVDGVVGPKTIAAINAARPLDFCNAVLDIRKAHFDRLVEQTPAYEKFSDGWNNRICQLRRHVNKCCKM